jgi:hypothetical protein
MDSRNVDCIILFHTFWRTIRLNAGSVQRRIPNTCCISRRLSLYHADCTSFPLSTRLDRAPRSNHDLLFIIPFIIIIIIIIIILEHKFPNYARHQCSTVKVIFTLQQAIKAEGVGVET